ncbi:hypothetical protein B0T17DRAFT_509007 [Bombardia bombarda]|uniref:Uncharacterized protein n=1 Tax=Bombardia bombarda TaxID=252184 RepID=A0AA39WU56_9PEZI|nr:hypothetical protein B0T17DRAFT_509007 [Bombardia bombarda]
MSAGAGRLSSIREQHKNIVFLSDPGSPLISNPACKGYAELADIDALTGPPCPSYPSGPNLGGRLVDQKAANERGVPTKVEERMSSFLFISLTTFANRGTFRQRLIFVYLWLWLPLTEPGVKLASNIQLPISGFQRPAPDTEPRLPPKHQIF